MIIIASGAVSRRSLLPEGTLPFCDASTLGALETLRRAVPDGGGGDGWPEIFACFYPDRSLTFGG